MLFEQIRQDIIKYYKKGASIEANCLKTVIADVQRNATKNYTDDIVIKVIQKHLKSIEENKAKGVKSSSYAIEVELLNSYLPETVTKKQIVDYLASIDFSKLKNYKQAIGMAKKHFAGKVLDMKMVSDIVDQLAHPKGRSL